MTKVSIITVCYNAAQTLQNTIDSVANQDYKNIEYIIIDGNSKDNTLAIIKKNEKYITTYISEPDTGIYHAMNKGISLASGDIIGILNADDIYTDQSVISQVVNTLETSQADALYADLQYVNGNKVIRNWISGPFYKEKFKFGWMPPHPTFFVKKEYYDKLGTFNLKFKIGADYELMLRFLYKNNLKCAYLPKVIIKMEVGGASNQSLKNRKTAIIESAMAWKINDLKMPFYLPVVKPLRKIGQYIFKTVS